ncbi:MAG: xylosidase/arabinosidase [Verrucomicrobia bacterium]|nr:xylosidase/arabinosidase [Verrucomicrobiota bacterium]
MHRLHAFLFASLILLAGCLSTRPPPAPWQEPVPREWPAVHALVAPPTLPRVPRDAVDATTLEGKVMAGYQGWFIAQGDGADLPWTHYGTGRLKRFEPGFATIDLWPDMTEAGPTERYTTAFRHADGSVAEVFTSRHPDTIDRHFRWMHDYGVDGVFLQRFTTELSNPALAAVRNQILARVRTSAARHGRTWALMYDLSGMRADTIERVVQEDWKRLVDSGRIRDDARLQRHRGKPVVAVWGIGFNDRRAYTLAECERLVRWLKDDPVYGGNCVVIGVPYYWRTLTNDTMKDDALHRICALADIVSPWAVGRLRTPDEAARSNATITADLAWTRAHERDYLPVLYPGFSWHNLQKNRGVSAPLAAIPRQNGAFYQARAQAAIAGGARMLYVAMFDELDEGTAIMKTAATPPVGTTPFANEPGVPPDRYLRLTGEIREQLRRSLER